MSKPCMRSFTQFLKQPEATFGKRKTSELCDHFAGIDNIEQTYQGPNHLLMTEHLRYMSSQELLNASEEEGTSDRK